MSSSGWFPDGHTVVMGESQPVGRRRPGATKDAEYYCEAVRAYLKYRTNFEGFWSAVESGYRRMEFEAKGSRCNDLKEVQPGRVYRIVHMTEGSVFSNSTKFFVEGYSPRLGGEMPPLLEDLINSEWQTETFLTREARVSIRDGSKYGTGILHTSYECDFEEERKEDTREKQREMAVENPQFEQVVGELETAAAMMDAQLPEEVGEATFETDSRVRREDIVTRRISPWHFLVDPDASSLETAQWVGRVIYADLQTVKEYEFFKNTAGLQPTPKSQYFRIIGRENGAENQDNHQEAMSDKIALYELFIRQRDGSWDLLVITADDGIELRRVKAPYWHGHPYAVLGWNADGDTFFGQSDLLPVWTEILSERLVVTKAMDGFAREQQDVTYYDSETITEKDMYGITAPDVGRLVGVKLGPNKQDIRASILKVPKDSKTPEVLNYLGFLEKQMMVSSGFSPNQFGQALKSETSASEAANIAEYATVAQAHKLSATELFLAQVAFQRTALACQFYDSTTITRILGADAAALWVKAAWTKRDIQNGLRVCVKPGSSRRVSDDMRLQRDMMALELSAKDPMAQAILNRVTLYKQLFRDAGFDMNSPLFTSSDPAVLAQLQAAALQGVMGGQAPAEGGGITTPSGEAGMQQMEQG